MFPCWPSAGPAGCRDPVTTGTRSPPWTRPQPRPALGSRIFLTTGRMGLAHFAHLTDPWFLVRSVDAPEPPHPPRMEVLLDRGPFTVEGERALLRAHRIDVLVTKDSGAAATAAKLTAAREAGIPVVVVGRPPVPDGVPVAAAPDEAAEWVRGYSARPMHTEPIGFPDPFH